MNKLIIKPLLFIISFTIIWEVAVVLFGWGIKTAGTYTPFLVTVFILFGLLIYWRNLISIKKSENTNLRFKQVIFPTLSIVWLCGLAYASFSVLLYHFLLPNYASQLAKLLESTLLSNGAPESNINKQLAAFYLRYTVAGLFLFKGLVTCLQGTVLALILSGLMSQQKL